MTRLKLVIGGKYNWKNQPERLIYLGFNWSGNGYWHQFEKVDAPGVVWCEVLEDQLDNFEETRPEGELTRAEEKKVLFAARYGQLANAGPPYGTAPRYQQQIRTKPPTEIELWNAEVERRKLEKKASKA